jgi:Response regulators consisting of a CheY-like receiver domain and a winged-helix DNA-binding domain
MEHVDHILIVDDDREIRELVGNYLKKNGLRTTVVADGRQMRSFLESTPVDLIVLDIMMPGDDGLVLCRELRAGKHKATPVLMLTARNDETDRIIGLEMGADDYLVKPFAARELLARINAVLRRTRMLPPNLVVTESGRCWPSGAGAWTPRPGTCSMKTARWSPSVARNIGCCGCSSITLSGCSIAINC